MALAKNVAREAKQARKSLALTMEPQEPPREQVPESAERLARTLFVGNVTIKIAKEKRTKEALRKMFETFGEIESIRVRSLIPNKISTKRLAAITGKISEAQETCNVFVVLRSAEEASKACAALNGTLFEGLHIRVDMAGNSDQKPATKKSIFIGNLPQTVRDESLWSIFASCGAISNVRVIRDRETGLSRGFGYVTFAEKASLELALQLNGTDCEGRPMRISKCTKPGYQKIKKAHQEKRAAAISKFKEIKKQGKSKEPKEVRSTLKGSKETPASSTYSLPRLQAKKSVTSTSKSHHRPERGKAADNHDNKKTPGKLRLAASHTPVKSVGKRDISDRSGSRPGQTDTPKKHPAEIRKERKLQHPKVPSLGKRILDRPTPSRATAIVKKARASQ